MAEPALKIAEGDEISRASSRRDKFVKLAESRTSTAIKAIRIIGKLGNKNAYDYDEADVRKIVKALADEIEALKVRMKTTKPSDGVDFKL
jgi:predicted amidohydrolase